MLLVLRNDEKLLSFSLNFVEKGLIKLKFRIKLLGPSFNLSSGALCAI